MGRSSRDFEYEEEDGFEIERDGHTFVVFGYASATYTSYYEPATYWQPEENDMEQDDFYCEIFRIEDENGEVVQMELTPEENAAWEQHMSKALDEIAEDGDNWEGYDDYDEPDYEPDYD